MVKITIPTKLVWRPGQHFFLRFLDLGIHAASSHPFTIANLPEGEKGSEGRVMEVYARIHGGITARLAKVAQTGSLKRSRVLLDGPYGGFEGKLEAYDRVLLLAGGSGLFWLPHSVLSVLTVTRNRYHVHRSALTWPHSFLRRKYDQVQQGARSLGCPEQRYVVFLPILLSINSTGFAI